MKLEVANERGESQGSLLNSASALDSVLLLAKQSLDFSDLGFINPNQVLSTEWAQSVCDQSNLKSINVTCLICRVGWESLRILNLYLLFIPAMLCSLQHARNLTHTHWEALDGFASKTYSVYFGSYIHHFILPLIETGLEQNSPELPHTCKA